MSMCHHATIHAAELPGLDETAAASHEVFALAKREAGSRAGPTRERYRRSDRRVDLRVLRRLWMRRAAFEGPVIRLVIEDEIP